MGHFMTGRAFSTYAPNDPGIVDRLRRAVRISAAPKKKAVRTIRNSFPGFLCSFSLGLDIFHAPNARWRWKSNGFGKSKAKLLSRSWARYIRRCGRYDEDKDGIEIAVSS